MEMRPRTFVLNIVSMSLSWISPTRSVPWAPPALLTATTSHTSEWGIRLGGCRQKDKKERCADNKERKKKKSAPRMSTLRNSCGTLDHSAATWVLSVTSSCTETIFPPSCTPAALCAAPAASATFSSWSARRETRIKFEPA